MAADRPDPGQQQREENAPQRTSQSVGRSTETSHRQDATSNRTARGDQERAIRSGREEDRSGRVTRQQQTPPVYGPGRGQLSPFTMMRRMAEDMDRLFENFGFGRTGFGLPATLGADLDRGLWRDASAFDQAAWMPQVETLRRGDKLVIRADLPGLKKDDVKVEIDDGILTISGERRDEQEEQRDDFYRSERTYGEFYRAVPLPDGVDANQCDASFNDGVLEVTIPAPKQQQRKAKQIQVK